MNEIKNDALSQWAEQQVKNNTVAAPETTEAPPVAQTAEVVPRETEVVEPQVVEQTPEAELASWDATPTETPAATPQSVYDFKKLGSALDFGEVNDEKELVAKVSELRTKLKQLEENPLAGIPDEFREVLKVTKAGEDWKSHLAESVVDYTKADPLKLYEEQYLQHALKLQKFRNADNTVNEDAIWEEYDKIPDMQKMLEGSRMQQSLINNQQTKKANLLRQAEEKISKSNQDLANSTKNLNDLLPFTNYGIKFEPKHSDHIYKGISNSSLTKKHLGVSYEDLVRSGADMKSVAKSIAAAEYSELMLKYKSNNVAVQTKKELLNKIQNVNLNPTSTAVQPDEVEKKKQTPAEILAEHFKNVNKSGLR